MAIALSKPVDRDALVLESIERLGLGIRELLKSALGLDPNNILQRLLARKAIRSVQGLPQKRAYYIEASEKPFGAQALQQRLALTWYVLMNAATPSIALKPEEVTELFGLEVPSGVHVLEAGAKPRLLQVYAPETVEVVGGIHRHVDKAKSFPKVAQAIEDRDYGFLVLVPWSSGLKGALSTALGGGGDLSGIEAGFIPQAKKLAALATQAHFVIERVATPETLTLALKENTA